MKRVILWMVTSLGLLCGQIEREPNKEDLDAVIAKWNELVKPGKVLETRASSAIFLTSEDDIWTVEEAAKINDYEGAATGLARSGNAHLQLSSIKVRLLNKLTNTLCISLSVAARIT